MSLATILGACPLFQGLYDQEIEAFIQNGRIEQYAAGTLVAAPDKLIEKLYIVLEGSLEQFHVFNDQELCFLELNIRDFFGENIFSNESHYDHMIKAKEDSQLISIEFGDIQSYYQKKPQAYAVMLMNILRMEQEKLRVSRGIISRLYFRENATLGTPIFGQRRLKREEVDMMIKRKKAV